MGDSLFSGIGRLRVVEMQFLQINYKLMRSLSNLSSSPVVCGNVQGLKQPKQLCPAELKPRLWFRAPRAALAKDRH